MCFPFPQIFRYFREKRHFRFHAPGINFASSNRAENRPLSFDSRVAFVECRKVVIQPTFCTTLPCLQENWINIIMHLSMLSPRVGEGEGGYPREFDSESLPLSRDFDT